MIDSILETLKSINNNYANFLLLVVAVVSAFVAFNEYVSKRRPYVLPEIAVEQTNDKWSFAVILSNKGVKGK